MKNKTKLTKGDQNINDNNKKKCKQPIIIKSCVYCCWKVFTNVNLSNDSRVSKRDVKFFGSQYVLDNSIQNTCI